MKVSVKICKVNADENGIVVNFDVCADDKAISNEYINLGKLNSKDEVTDMLLALANRKVNEPKYCPPLLKDLEGKIVYYNKVIENGSD